MANLQIKGMDDELYAQLKSLAASANSFFIEAVSGKETPAARNQNSGPGIAGTIRLLAR